MAKTTKPSPAPEAIDVTGTAVETEKTNIPPETQEEETVASETVVSGTDFTTTVRNLLKEKNCKKITGLKVKNVKLKAMDNYVRASLSLMSKVPGFIPVRDEDGELTGDFKQGLTNIIYTSSFAISGLLKNNEDFAWLGDYVVDHPECIGILLSMSNVNVIQQFISKDTDYVNPFTTKEDIEPIQFEHDTIIYHVIDIDFGKPGKLFADKLMDKFINRMFETEEL